MQIPPPPFIGYGKGGGEVSVWQRLLREADVHSQPLPWVPLVELAGDRRVLIENHRGVVEYTPGRIGIRVAFGTLTVWGEGLEIGRMTRQRLVIHGKIRTVTLEGRK